MAEQRVEGPEPPGEGGRAAPASVLPLVAWQPSSCLARPGPLRWQLGGLSRVSGPEPLGQAGKPPLSSATGRADVRLAGRVWTGSAPSWRLQLFHAHLSLGLLCPHQCPRPCLAVGPASPCAWNVCLSRDAPLVTSGSDEDEQKVAVASEAVSMGPGQEAPPLPTPVPRCAG